MNLLRSRPKNNRNSKSRREPKGGSWTFFTNHAHVLFLLSMNEDLRLRDIAEQVGITERAVQKILSELAEEGFLRAEKVGRENRYELFLDHPLRHPIERHITVADIVAILRD